MSETCSSICEAETPTPTNQCNDFEDTYDIPGYCSNNQDTTIDWCENNISAPDEWSYSTTGQTQCVVVNQQPMVDAAGNELNCLGGAPFSSCGAVGFSSRCLRVGFKGDPLSCCMADYICNSSSSNTCFEYNTTGTSQRTCAPETRNITSQVCQNNVSDYCTGEDLAPDDTSWIYRWINADGTPLTYDATGNPLNNGCLYALNRNIYSLSNDTCGTGPLKSASGYLWGQNLISRVFAKYQRNGLTFGALPGTRGYTIFQDFLQGFVCNENPGLCSSGLERQCSRYTTEDLLRNPELINVCGCYLPDIEYSNYSNNYGIPKQCTPLCNRETSIPIADGNGDPITCTQGVCLIDNVAVNVINSSVKGGIQVSNVCNGCTTGEGSSCQCVLEDLTIDVFNSTVGNNIIFNNMCNSSLCTSTVNGQIVTVPCDSDNDPEIAYEDALNSATKEEKKRYWIYIAITLVVTIIIAGIILFFYRTTFPVILVPIFAAVIIVIFIILVVSYYVITKF